MVDVIRGHDLIDFLVKSRRCLPGYDDFLRPDTGLPVVPTLGAGNPILLDLFYEVFGDNIRACPFEVGWFPHQRAGDPNVPASLFVTDSSRDAFSSRIDQILSGDIYGGRWGMNTGIPLPTREPTSTVPASEVTLIYRGDGIRIRSYDPKYFDFGTPGATRTPTRRPFSTRTPRPTSTPTATSTATLEPGVTPSATVWYDRLSREQLSHAIDANIGAFLTTWASTGTHLPTLSPRRLAGTVEAMALGTPMPATSGAAAENQARLVYDADGIRIRSNDQQLYLSSPVEQKELIIHYGDPPLFERAEKNILNISAYQVTDEIRVERWERNQAVQAPIHGALFGTGAGLSSIPVLGHLLGPSSNPFVPVAAEYGLFNELAKPFQHVLGSTAAIYRSGMNLEQVGIMDSDVPPRGMTYMEWGEQTNWGEGWMDNRNNPRRGVWARARRGEIYPRDIGPGYGVWEELQE